MCNANYSGCALGAPRRNEAEEQPGAPRAKVLATRPELGGAFAGAEAYGLKL